MTRKNIYEAPSSLRTKPQAMNGTYYHVRIVQYTKHTTWNGKPNDEWLPTSQAEYHCADAKEVLRNVEQHLKA